MITVSFRYEGSDDEILDQMRRVNAVLGVIGQKINRVAILKQLDEAGRTGLDILPGDELAKDAAAYIRQLEQTAVLRDVEVRSYLSALEELQTQMRTKETLTVEEQKEIDQMFTAAGSIDPWDYSQKFIDYCRDVLAPLKEKILRNFNLEKADDRDKDIPTVQEKV